MSVASAPAILILTQDTQLRRQWADSLVGASCRVWTEPQAVPAAVDLDVIVTNEQVLHAVLDTQSQQLQDGKVGVVAIGGGGPADIALPPDASQRELRLACRMLSEIIQLRRRVRRGARLQRVLSHLALTDPLTRLPNRRAWEKELKRKVEGGGLRVESSESPPKLSLSLNPQPSTLNRGRGCCLAVLDLDRFDEVNERLGHAAGDAVLRDAAGAIRQSLPAGDFVARLGGDEFGLLLLRPDESNAVEALERVRGRLASRLINAVPDGLTATIGYSYRAPGDHLSAEAMFSAADEALRSAKRAGRNRTAAE
jgi:diguanylate cyclase (GGDEF)-like protein